MNGVIDWFARNHVAANLLVVGIFVAGLMGLWSGKREVFPSVSSDMISVSVVYRGAAPSEVEQGVCIKIEEAIQGIEGIKKILSTATEGLGTTRAELVPGTDIPEALEEIKSAVEAIDTFPQLTEKPVIEEIVVEKQVINVAIAGEVGAMALRQFAELVRDDLTAIPDITQVRLANARPYEISIEVSPSALRQHGLTFDAVAAAIRSSSVDLPGGGIKTNGGEILLRSIHQAYRGEDFESILLMVREDGTRVLVKDVCRVIDGFRESDQESLFDGKPCLMVQVFRVGNQNALTISSKVQEYVENQQSLLPAGIQMTTWQDDASYLRSRQELLVKNGFFGRQVNFSGLKGPTYGEG
ncbi:MAG: efflux RND transporter permease subunit [Limisphaerales bacterium]